MLQGERIVPYDSFMEILADAERLGLCNAPEADSLPGFSPGVMVVLALDEWGCRGTDGSLPLHHRIRAVFLFERVVHFVDIPDEKWATLPTVDQYFATLPLVTVPAGRYAELAEEERRERLASSTTRIAEILKVADEHLAARGAGEEPPPEEDGGAGVREPLPDPRPTGDAGAAIPSEVSVG